MYYWSDRQCYYVIEVIDQKHIRVLPYEVCADHSKKGGMGHQNWLYFKTAKEHAEYINDCIDKGLIKSQYVKKYNLDEVKENSVQDWYFRYGNWCVKQEYWYDVKLEKPKWNKLPKVSIGIKDYYYDWEF